ncbi:MAG: STAS domain-containing protein [Nitrospinae bacterium]|nr:STAS domain-containing protein [Nitrospinota bacterium]
MKIETRKTETSVILDLVGNIRTSEDYSEFKKSIDEVIDKGAAKIIMNFAEVRFINSSGLGRLVLAAKKIKESNGVLGIINLSDDLKELFMFTRLDTKISIFKSEEEAVKGM